MDSRAHVGPKELFDTIGTHQFNTIVEAGIRKTQKVLDYGCGCLRMGKRLVPYLRKGNYTGFDVNADLIEDGRGELGEDLSNKKAPKLIVGDPNNFDTVDDIPLDTFDWAVYHSIFNHASQDQIVTLLSSAASYIKEGGAVVATFLAGDSDYTGDIWNYPMAHTYKAETISALCEAAGLQFELLGQSEAHPTGQTWFKATIPHYAEAEE